jgi:predicted ABC-type ATPase
VPRIVIIAGPNGAGKTTFAREYLRTADVGFQFVNADEIARLSIIELGSQGQSNIRAGRIMLERIDEYVEARADLVIETTLATRIYANKILVWRTLGYHVALIYLRLRSVEDALARVRKRVELGGHNIPEQVIRRRFPTSAEYLEKIYKNIVDAWDIRESREGKFVRVESSETGWPKN